ncbi:hypothetical protein [Agromyces mariniharenae]|uniref:Cytochrome P450 n=1 Tax=Agromyces mariniharenae TaxID=2604423 RepID=A0A5S4UYD1_9MICO|nr:hypothetical protein [Agromyces mariniharenae]TYL51118.1 hypothetical protein FYC51_18530 [Agromyces mariniharenae]
MTDVAERSEVQRILEDPAYTVPEADAASTSPGEQFRANTSRFVNGATHAARRGRLEVLLAGIDVDELAADAASRTRAMLPAGIEAVAAHVPVACLAARLGFADPDAAPALVGVLAAHYPTGDPSSAADAAAARLLGAAGDRDGDPALRVQLLVQAHAATAGLITAAVRLPAARDTGVPTADLLAAVLRDAPPVRQTRRLAPDGHALVLRLDGADRAPQDPRTLVFGAGPRACPAMAQALAIAAAVVDEVRAC